ncbi:MAG: inositol monophosphatase [Anaerolineaceae bacterium]|nr:inositol monophosphatase [Anaerolineaceae bacterium]
MEPTLQQLVLWARQAGEILRAGFGQRLEIGYKADHDLVTQIDQESEAFLVDQIRRFFPSHDIVGEESGATARGSRSCWYIDPLDGTTNFAHRLPYFCVSLAYVRDGESELGVIYDPMRDECYSAERGKGAWLNGARIQVSDTGDLKQCLLVTGFSHNIDRNHDRNISLYSKINRQTQGVRRLGAAALNMAYVAAGRLEGYWELEVKTWDIAAGMLLIREAGGVVSKVDGSGTMLAEPISVIAATPFTHPFLLQNLSGDG